MKLLIVFYLVMASYFFTTWLEFFDQETRLSSVDSCLSKVALVISTIFWPLVVPIAYLYLLEAEKPKLLDVNMSDNSSSLRHLIISIFLSNLLTICGLAAFVYIEFLYHSV